MGLFYDIGLRAKHMIGPLIAVCSIVYFGFYVVNGERGLLSYWQLKQMISTTQPVLEDAQAQRKLLENRVSLLRPDNLDLDMLEERARVMLNFGYVNDIVILYDKETVQ